MVPDSNRTGTRYEQRGHLEHEKRGGHISVCRVSNIYMPYLPRETFSPASGGRRKVRRDKEDIRAQGMIKLKP